MFWCLINSDGKLTVNAETEQAEIYTSFKAAAKAILGYRNAVKIVECQVGPKGAW